MRTTGRLLPGLLVLVASCTYKEIPLPAPVVVDCSKSTLVVNQAAKTDASSCDKVDGSFTIGVTGGASPFVFSLDGGDFQPTATFAGLGPGYYSVVTRDANQCEKTISVEIAASGSNLTASAVATGDSECLTGNGSITITASGGTAPYTFQLDTDPATNTTGIFTGLKSGNHRITLRDTVNCLKTINVVVPRLATGTSYLNDIQPILAVNCALSGCHDGSTGSSTNWTVLSNVQAEAQTIKLRTGNRSMPLTGSLTQAQIDLIACWVDDGALDN